jgi:uroporphyrinogen III methyltransferase/synthase
VFARSAEELEALAAADIPFEVVPGITAALAAASYVGIPITHRDHASAVAFITGQQQAEGAQEIDWGALARFPGTLVLYMGVTTVGEWTQRLIAEGKSPATPAAIVRRCSWSDQLVIRCELGEVAEQLTPANKLRPPVIVIVGDVARLGARFNWFDARPLRHLGVWLARPDHQNDWLERQLTELGAEVFVEPAIQIRPPASLAEMDQAIAHLAAGNFHGVVFSSRNAVQALLDRVWAQAYDVRIFAGMQIACVGSKTAEYLAARGLRADVVPPHDYSATTVLEELAARQVSTGQRWLLPQADQARDTLAAGLAHLGAEVERVTAYEAVPVAQLAPEIADALAKGAIQWVTVTSPNMARTLHGLSHAYLSQLKPLSLSPAISQTLEQLGWPAQAEASEATEEALLQALLAAVQRQLSAASTSRKRPGASTGALLLILAPL